jgi:predicted transposase YdaD
VDFLLKEKVMEEGLAKGRKEGKTEMIIASSKAGLPIETIANISGLTTDKISEILKQHKEK